MTSDANMPTAERGATRGAFLLAGALLLAAGTALGQAPAPPRRDTVVTPIRKATNPIPPEAQSAAVTRFSFIAYGDTRGRHDGVELQAEHTLVVEAMLNTIRTLSRGPDPVKFVLQSGDAVVNGQDATQWNVSFSPLINRLTSEAGVPYFLAPGNHDVTSMTDLTAPGRLAGLRNFYSALSALIPQEGAPRRLKAYPTYAFGYGNTFVLAFDSNIAGDSVQFAWVKGQLEGLDRKRYVNVVAFAHHPVFSSGPHGGSVVEQPTAAIRGMYMPLFRKHHVRLYLAGHEHLFEHWVERYKDATGRHRMDLVVSGGGGAPLYRYTGEPDLRDYLRANLADSVSLQHLVAPSIDPGANPFHFLVVHVNGDRVNVDVIGVDWGRGFSPYRSARAVLADSGGVPNDNRE